MLCKTCKTELNYVKDMGWLHPRSDCPEFDGIIIDDLARDVWNKEYSGTAGIEMIDSLKLDIIELENAIKNYQNDYEELENDFNELTEQYEELLGLWMNTFDFKIKTLISRIKEKIIRRKKK